MLYTFTYYYRYNNCIVLVYSSVKYVLIFIHYLLEDDKWVYPFFLITKGKADVIDYLDKSFITVTFRVKATKKKSVSFNGLSE